MCLTWWAVQSDGNRVYLAQASLGGANPFYLHGKCWMDVTVESEDQPFWVHLVESMRLLDKRPDVILVSSLRCFQSNHHTYVHSTHHFLWQPWFLRESGHQKVVVGRNMGKYGSLGPGASGYGQWPDSVDSQCSHWRVLSPKADDVLHIVLDPTMDVRNIEQCDTSSRAGECLCPILFTG